MSDNRVFHTHLRALNRADQVAALFDGTGLPTSLRGAIPGLPDDAIQTSTTGKVGLPNSRNQNKTGSTRLSDTLKNPAAGPRGRCYAVCVAQIRASP